MEDEAVDVTATVTEEKTLDQFIIENNIVIAAQVLGKRRATIEERHTGVTESHIQYYKINVRRLRKQFTSYWAIHDGGHAPSNIIEVFESYHRDVKIASMVFSEWVTTQGYDLNNRADRAKAMGRYKRAEINAGKLRKFLGHDLYEEFS